MPGINLQYVNVPVATRTAQTTTTNGNVFVSDNDPKIGNGSARFGGTTQISVDNANLKINNTTEKTIEFWVKDSTAPARVYLSMGNFANTAVTSWWQIYSQSGNRLELGRSGAAIFVSAANTYFTNGSWNHFAWTTNGANNSWYVNGNLIGTFTRTAVDWNTSSNVMAIGAQNVSTQGLIGNMDELRISDIVRYTANFTPQTTAFTNDANTQLLLHMDGANASTSFPDDNLAIAPGGITIQYADVPVATRTAITTTSVNSAQVSNAEFVFGNGSALFSSVNSAITVPNTGGVLNLGTADFTIEFRYRPISKPTASPQIVFGNYTGAMGANNWAISDRETAANKFTFVVPNFGGNSIPLISTTTPVNGNWYAVAVTRQGSTLRMFINGTLEATQTFAGSIDGNTNTTISIGTSGAGTNAYINGYIDEVRFSNIARYTANYTVATQPFVNDANTTLLLHCDGTNGSTSFPDDNLSLLPGGITITY